MRYDDVMGDECKAVEAVETERRVAPGECAMIRLDGIAFSNFTGSMEKPYDTAMADAMLATAARLLDAFNPDFVYTQSDEITMVFGPDRAIPYDGRLQKMASAYAGKATAFFKDEALMRFSGGVSELRQAVEGDSEHLADAVKAFLRLFDRTARSAPAFDGRAVSATREMAALFLVWREIDARRNAALGAGRAAFEQGQLAGKKPGDIKDMLLDLGVDFYGQYPNHFRRGTFMRKRKVEMRLTEAELERVPLKHREAKRNEVFHRSRIVEVEDRPPFYMMTNMVEFAFDDAEPVAVEKPFAQHIVP